MAVGSTSHRSRMLQHGFPTASLAASAVRSVRDDYTASQNCSGRTRSLLGARAEVLSHVSMLRPAARLVCSCSDMQGTAFSSSRWLAGLRQESCLDSDPSNQCRIYRVGCRTVVIGEAVELLHNKSSEGTAACSAERCHKASRNFWSRPLSFPHDRPFDAAGARGGTNYEP